MKELSLLLLLGATLYQVYAQAIPPHATCLRTFSKLGCFQEKATTMDMMINDRDKTSPYYQGYFLNWKEFKESVHSLACRCAEKAKSLGYAYIAIRFWGECYAGKNEADLAALVKDPSRKSNQCVNPKFTACVDSEEEECVGKAFADYIYSLTTKSDIDVNGGYSDWSEYSDCSATCGNGIQTKERTCTNPVPKGAGKDCSLLGESTETRACKIVECPVNGGFTPWTDYGACDKTCGGGAQTRSRSCTDPAPAHGGKPCVGETLQSRECNDRPCPVDGDYGSWSDYGACSASCGPGTQQSTRQCNNPAPAHGGRDCTHLGSAVQTRECEVRKCPVNGGYGPWEDYNACSVTCGGGLQSRSRQCNNPSPADGGDDCTKLGPSQENQECNKQACPPPYGGEIDTRICEYQRIQLSCDVGVIEIISASYGRKSRDYCGFADWWSTNCHASTSQAKMSENCDGKKSCIVDVSNSVFGDPCVGTVKYLEVKHRCKGVDGGYGPWSDYGACSTSCGPGIQQSTRQCNSPAPAYGGRDCEGLGSAVRTQNCEVKACPIIYGPVIDSRVCEYDRIQLNCPEGVIEVIAANYGRLSKDYCGFIDWWSTNCRASTSKPKMAELCDGKQSCLVDVSNSVFGDPCIGTVKYVEVKHRCKGITSVLNGGYGPWSEYGECSTTCGVGTQQSTRECNNPEPANGGKNCEGPAVQTRVCEVRKCPVNGGYGPWNEFGACSATCGVGVQSRTRPCNNPVAAFGGDDCAKLGPSADQRPCNVQECPPRYGPEIDNRVCEWAKVDVSCADGVIDIVSANYGRTSTVYCGYLLWWQLNCRAGISSSKMAELCNGKKSCIVEATNSVFGDPCVGTFKYLEVKHRCKFPA